MENKTEPLIRELKIAEKAVRDAGKLTLELQRNGLTSSIKADYSPVTNADGEAELLIRSQLHNAFPEHGFYGEETKPLPSKNGYTWACDPIDGTWSYLNQESTWTICLALIHEQQVQLAVIYNPLTGEMFKCGVGIPCTVNDIEMPVVKKSELNQCVLNFFMHRSRIEDIRQLYHLRLEYRVSKLVSTGGSIAYALACVAKGAHNIFIGFSTRNTQVWDIPAGIFMIRSVGGMVTDLNGNDIGLTLPAKTHVIAATNAKVHSEFLKMLHEEGFGPS